MITQEQVSAVIVDVLNGVYRPNTQDKPAFTKKQMDYFATMGWMKPLYFGFRHKANGKSSLNLLYP